MVTVMVVVGGYRPLPASLTAFTRRANSAKLLSSTTPARLYAYDTLLEGLAQHLEDVAAELRPFIEQEHAMMCQRHVARPRHLASTDQAHIGDRVMGSATRARRDDVGRAPVRPATRWMRVVSMASGRVIAGRIVVRRRATIDGPAPGGPSMRRLWSKRLHSVQLDARDGG